MSSSDIGSLIRNIKEHKRKISTMDKRILPLYNQVKNMNFNNKSVEYNLKKIILHLNKWRNQIQRNENKIIEELNQVTNKHKNKIININLTQLKDLQDEHEIICKNQYLFIRFLLE